MLISLKKSEEKLVAVEGNTQFYKAEAKQSENVTRYKSPYLFFMDLCYMFQKKLFPRILTNDGCFLTMSSHSAITVIVLQLMIQ